MKLTFTIERAAEYQGEWKDTLGDAKYVLSISNGDVYPLNTVEAVESIIADELFLHGYSDDEEPKTMTNAPDPTPSTFTVGDKVRVPSRVFDEGDLLETERGAFAANDYIGVIAARIIHEIEPRRCWRVEAGGEYVYLTAEEMEHVL